jgi:hypothetical protein
MKKKEGQMQQMRQKCVNASFQKFKEIILRNPKVRQYLGFFFKI